MVVPQGGMAIMPPGAPIYDYGEEDTVIHVHGTGPWGINSSRGGRRVLGLNESGP